MKRTILPLALLALCLSGTQAYGQLAKQKDITFEEINKQIGILANKDDDASRKQLLVEAKALAESKNERFVTLASRIYNFVGNEEEVDKINKSITKRFPKGIKARQNEFENIFDEDAVLTGSKVEKQYQQWLKKFPKTSFAADQQQIYDQGLSNMAIVYYREKNTAKAKEYADQLIQSNNFPIYASSLTKALQEQNLYHESLPFIEKAYQASKDAIQSSDPKIKNSNIAGRFTSLAPLYATTLKELGKTKESASVLEDLFKTYSYAKSSADLTNNLASLYVQQGRDLDAFNLLNSFIVNQGVKPEVVEQVKPLYQKLNNNKGDFDQYLEITKTQAKEALTAKYKSEMIKKEAPNFSLVNLEGKTISLADLKGKVVVLDFWATWCGPCKISFPGMQAAVNKYKDDKEVEFLFIDTWQNEKNFEELVRNFIAENKYTFNVLFDEMKDRYKSVTTSYGVKGIPHKVVIDKEGFIRFESSGGTADVEKIVNEISTKVELARNAK